MGFGEMLNSFASKYEHYITPKFCASPYTFEYKYV